jgi:hypothetical protein
MEKCIGDWKNAAAIITNVPVLGWSRAALGSSG